MTSGTSCLPQCQVQANFTHHASFSCPHTSAAGNQTTMNQHEPATLQQQALSQQCELSSWESISVSTVLCLCCSERATAVLGQLSRAGTKGDAFLTGVQLIAHGCQRAFEVSDLPGLLPALTKVSPVCFVPYFKLAIRHLCPEYRKWSLSPDALSDSRKQMKDTKQRRC